MTLFPQNLTIAYSEYEGFILQNKMTLFKKYLNIFYNHFKEVPTKMFHLKNIPFFFFFLPISSYIQICDTSKVHIIACALTAVNSRQSCWYIKRIF